MPNYQISHIISLVTVMKSIFEIEIPKSQLQSQTELYKGLFTVVGGSQNDYVTARRIGLASNSTNNILLGSTSKYHINGGSAVVGDKVWLVGGRDEVIIISTYNFITKQELFSYVFSQLIRISHIMQSLCIM